jgi:hypothetical protein
MLSEEKVELIKDLNEPIGGCYLRTSICQLGKRKSSSLTVSNELFG